jgi:endonuclease YncB( thermonuclease family)
MALSLMENGAGPRTTNNKTGGRIFTSMKQLIALTLICSLFFLFQQPSSADTWHRAKWVIDGDTIVINNGRKVRYIGIDARPNGLTHRW